MGVFLCFAATMAALAGVTLTWPGTPLDVAWRLNPRAFGQLQPLGRPIGWLFLALAACLAIAAIGWFRRRRWGWLLATIIIAVQFAGDLGNVVAGRAAEGSVGAAVAGVLLISLLRPSVRTAFLTPR